MDESALQYARLSDLAYRPLAEQQAEAGRLGYSVDAGLSNDNRTVFYHPESRKAVVAFRGTEISNPADLASDAMVAAGLQGFSPRFRTSTKVTRRAMRKYGADNVVATGHSLGGSQALHVNRRLGVESHSFNPGAGPRAQGLGLKERVFAGLHPGSRRAQNARRSTVYTTGVDPISVNATFGADHKVVIRPRSLNVHGLGNFLG